MTLSRKDFFRQGFFSLGETLLKVSGTVREVQESLNFPAHDVEPIPDKDTVARVDNQHCLAKNCGCFSCAEHCDTRAITVVMGEGIRIDETLCTGCGTCEYICPVTPKAVTTVPRR